MHSNVFVEISALIALCAGISMVMRLMRQPLIIGYIITGLLVGPSLLGLVKSPVTMMCSVTLVLPSYYSLWALA
jgi:Kef-type K+ transport system membrane component KefB